MAEVSWLIDPCISWIRSAGVSLVLVLLEPLAAPDIEDGLDDGLEVLGGDVVDAVRDGFFLTGSDDMVEDTAEDMTEEDGPPDGDGRASPRAVKTVSSSDTKVVSLRLPPEVEVDVAGSTCVTLAS